VPVDENEVFRWALSLAQAEEVARGVRGISKAYGGMIMDTEFCIDSADRLWFVQARPETRWNDDFDQHPDTIFMRRKEVDPKALTDAELILEGNGASRGAGQGVVKFLRSALELNKVNKGDILAAERTDPDMVPGMRIASAIWPVGDTSRGHHLRELGILRSSACSAWRSSAPSAAGDHRGRSRARGRGRLPWWTWAARST
jgi:pyruvate,water dikinase